MLPKVRTLTVHVAILKVLGALPVTLLRLVALALVAHQYMLQIALRARLQVLDELAVLLLGQSAHRRHVLLQVLEEQRGQEQRHHLLLELLRAKDHMPSSAGLHRCTQPSLEVIGARASAVLLDERRNGAQEGLDAAPRTPPIVLPCDGLIVRDGVPNVVWQRP